MDRLVFRGVDLFLGGEPAEDYPPNRTIPSTRINESPREMKKRNLTFDNLFFKPESSNSRSLKATLQFPNGYGCNVYMYSSNTNRELPYEFELTFLGKPTADDRISDENVGYCSKDDICDFIKIAQKL